MFTLNCNGNLLVAKRPLVMGIINVTDDSFYSGSRFNGDDAILDQAAKMLSEQADIIDIGAQSTRPGSKPIGPEKELAQVSRPIQKIRKAFPDAVISIDTFHPKVAAEAIAAGASMVNNVGAGLPDQEMIDLVATMPVPYICMHMKGTPADMIHHATYENVTLEALDYFIAKIKACRSAGIKDVIIDPGFGFAKDRTQNFILLKHLNAFKMLDCPILVGLSRKSTIYKTLNITPADALNGSTVMHTIALMNGANILRVHDVKEAVEAVKLFEQYELANAAD